jgi:hypothetical protein
VVFFWGGGEAFGVFFGGSSYCVCVYKEGREDDGGVKIELFLFDCAGLLMDVRPHSARTEQAAIVTHLPQLEQEDGELVLVDSAVPVSVHLEQLRDGDGWVV